MSENPLSFNDLTGCDPFPWQERLLGQLRKGEPPDTLDIPTGLGKTSVITLWLLAHLQGAALPRRLFYVVDRRAVVDQASAEAERLRERLQALGTDVTLSVSTLRGQHVDNRQWLQNPAGLAIVVGTVDMIGSRLLFSGYGVSRGMRPVHAGLMGHDALFVLDEAHLVPPFEALVRSCVAAGSALRPVASRELPPTRFLSLSATQYGESGPNVMRLESSDYENAVVNRRVNAEKHLGRRSLAAGEKLPAAMVDEVLALLQQFPDARLAVFCNRRGDAEKIAEDRTLKQRFPDDRMALLTGARRVRERSQAAHQLASLGFIAGISETDTQGPALLIATSAGEVGVDLDAQHAVLDLVPWERMVQRLGRVNRRGNGVARVRVLDEGATTADWEKTSKADPDRVRQLLDDLPATDAGYLAGPAALSRLAHEQPENIRVASTRSPHYPELQRPQLDAWSLTGLKVHTGRPQIAPWLRGWLEDDPPQCTLLWRHHMPPVDSVDADIEGYFRAASPQQSEMLELPVYQVEQWLIAHAAAIERYAASPQHRIPQADALETPRNDVPLCLRYWAIDYRNAPAPVVLNADGTLRNRLPSNWLTHFKAMNARERRDYLDKRIAGAMLILPDWFGGLAVHGLLHAGELASVETVRDHVPAGESWLADEEHMTNPSWTVEERPSKDSQENERPISDGSRDHVIYGNEIFRLPLNPQQETADSWLVVRRIVPGADEATGSACASSFVSLDSHLDAVASKAGALGQALELSAESISLLRLAARLHDRGKVSPAWQRYARASDQAAPVARAPQFGNPRELCGYRHEFGSLRIAEQDAEVANLAPLDRDLVLHLVASHHGHARPFISPAGADVPPSMAEQSSSEAALRFARLQAHWGPWGLAWWEALFRAADRDVSIEERQTHG